MPVPSAMTFDSIASLPAYLNHQYPRDPTFLQYPNAVDLNNRSRWLRLEMTSRVSTRPQNVMLLLSSVTYLSI